MIKHLSLLASALLLAASGSVHAVPMTQTYTANLTARGFTLPLFDTLTFRAPLDDVSVAIHWGYSGVAQLILVDEDISVIAPLPVSFAPIAQLTFSDGGLISFEQYLLSHSVETTFGPTNVVLFAGVAKLVSFGAIGSLLAPYSSNAFDDLSYFSDTSNSTDFRVFCTTSLLDLDPGRVLAIKEVNATVFTPATFSCGATVTYSFDDGNDPPINNAPEPGSMALVGLALAGLGLTARRRNAK